MKSLIINLSLTLIIEVIHYTTEQVNVRILPQYSF